MTRDRATCAGRDGSFDPTAATAQRPYPPPAYLPASRPPRSLSLAGHPPAIDEGTPRLGDTRPLVDTSRQCAHAFGPLGAGSRFQRFRHRPRHAMGRANSGGSRRPYSSRSRPSLFARSPVPGGHEGAGFSTTARYQMR